MMKLSNSKLIELRNDYQNAAAFFAEDEKRKVAFAELFEISLPTVDAAISGKDPASTLFMTEVVSYYREVKPLTL